MRRRALMAMTFGALMMLGLAVPAQAADPTFIEPNCGGEQRVAAQSDVTLFYGWQTNARRQAVKFLERSRVELTVDGERIANADLLWSKPAQIPALGGWVTFWEYKLGRLGRGNSIDTNFKLIFDEPSWDGVAWYGPGTFANYDCRVFTRA